MNLRSVLTVFLGCLAVVSIASEINEPKQKGEWVISTGFGFQNPRNSDITIRQPGSNTNLTYHNVNWDDEAEQQPPIYSLRAIYWPKPDSQIGFGFEFVHLKFVAQTNRPVQVSGTLNGNPYNTNEPMSNTVQQFAVTNGMNMYQALVVGRRQFSKSESYPSGKFSLYGGLGVGAALPHPVTRVLGSASGRYEWGGFTWHAMGGFEYRITPKLGLLLEYKYQDYKANLDITNGTASTRLTSNSFWIMTSYRL